MKKLVPLFLMLAFASCEASSSNYTQPSYEETKMTLEEQERANPIDFLSDESTYRKNLIGEWVIEGKVSNSASFATYKDVVLQITYYSETETEIGSENKVIYKYFAPGSVQQFKAKSFGVAGAKSIGVSVISAHAVN